MMLPNVMLVSIIVVTTYKVVVILCFLSTVTTSLEYQLSVETKYVDKPTGDLCKNVSDVTAMQQKQIPIPNDNNETSEFLISNNTIAVSSRIFNGNGVHDVKVFDTNGDYVDTILTDANHSVTSANVSIADVAAGRPCTTDVSI